MFYMIKLNKLVEFFCFHLYFTYLFIHFFLFFRIQKPKITNKKKIYRRRHIYYGHSYVSKGTKFFTKKSKETGIPDVVSV